MRANRRACVRHPLFVLPVALMLVILLPTVLFSANNTPSTDGMPDVLVMINANTTNGGSVSFTYQGTISKSQTEQDLKTFARETGWAPNNVRISNDNGAGPGDFPMTSVEFATGPILNTKDGYIPVEPIVTTFKRMKRIQIQYFVPNGFKYTGISDYENRYVNIKFSGGAGTYSYSVQVKDHNFDKLGLPGPAASGTSNNQRKGGSTGIIWVIIAALVAAAVVFVVTDKLNKKNRQPTNRRS